MQPDIPESNCIMYKQIQIRIHVQCMVQSRTVKCTVQSEQLYSVQYSQMNLMVSLCILSCIVKPDIFQDTCTVQPVYCTVKSAARYRVASYLVQPGIPEGICTVTE